MGNDESRSGDEVEARVETYAISRAVGRAIATLGSMEVLLALNAGPRRWKELKQLTGLQDMALNRALKALVAANLVVARKTTAEREGIEAYEKTPAGPGIHKILLAMEKEGHKEAVESLGRADGKA